MRHLNVILQLAGISALSEVSKASFVLGSLRLYGFCIKGEKGWLQRQSTHDYNCSKIVKKEKTGLQNERSHNKTVQEIPRSEFNKDGFIQLLVI